MEGEEWQFCLSYMGGTVRFVRVGAVPPSTDVDWVLAAVLGDVEDCQILGLAVTRTLLYWGCSMEAEILMNREEESRVAEIIELEDAEDSHVIMIGRSVRCDYCLE